MTAGANSAAGDMKSSMAMPASGCSSICNALAIAGMAAGAASAAARDAAAGVCVSAVIADTGAAAEASPPAIAPSPAPSAVCASCAAAGGNLPCAARSTALGTTLSASLLTSADTPGASPNGDDASAVLPSNGPNDILATPIDYQVATSPCLRTYQISKLADNTKMRRIPTHSWNKAERAAWRQKHMFLL